MKKVFFIVFMVLISAGNSSGQQLMEQDKCGFPDTTSMEFKIAASGNWGYGYDTLLYDLGEWKKNPFVTVDSIGATVQLRTMFLLTIQDTTIISRGRKRVWIHARTHPGEVQGTWVTNEIIKILLSNSPLGKLLRDSCVFSIVPMYNPDGVELGKARENANNIDIESNWDTTKAYPSQPEVAVLRKTFTALMAMNNPIQIALNMHSAYECHKFFWFHAATGTSTLYAGIQKHYIDTVVSNYPEWIQPWNSHISWTSTAAKQYPESWFWYNHREKVLALTYEDMNCITAHSFDTTALAIAQGIADHLGITRTAVSVTDRTNAPNGFELLQNFPNPFNPTTTISYHLTQVSDVTLRVYDILGREIAELVNSRNDVGTHSVRFDASGYASGLYIYRIVTNTSVEAKAMHFLK